MMTQIEYPTIETKKVTLKVLTLEDTTNVYHHFADEEITRFMDIEACRDEKKAEEIIQYHLDDLGCRWGIFTHPNQEFAGTCGFHYIRQTDHTLTTEIGFDLAKRFWGNGYMWAALGAIISFGFSNMSLDVIDATVDPKNVRSINLMERLDFKREAELKDGLIYYFLKIKECIVTYLFRGFYK